MSNIHKIIDSLPMPKVGTFLEENLSIMSPEKIEKVLDVVKEIIDLTAPRKIFEIGTHVGHSSLTFLEKSSAEIISTDIDDWWVSKDQLNQVQRVFDLFYPNRYKQLIHNSQDHDFFINLDLGEVDMIHVDGLHEYDYCRNDIVLGKKLKCKYFLIDDYQHPSMKKSAEDEGLILIKEWQKLHSVEVSLGLLQHG